MLSAPVSLLCGPLHDERDRRHHLAKYLPTSGRASLDKSENAIFRHRNGSFHVTHFCPALIIHKILLEGRIEYLVYGKSINTLGWALGRHAILALVSRYSLMTFYILAGRRSIRVRETSSKRG